MHNLESRVRKLEAIIPRERCSNPEHDRLNVLFGEDDAMIDAKVKSIRECPACKDQVIVVMRIRKDQQPQFVRNTVTVNINEGLDNGKI